MSLRWEWRTFGDRFGAGESHLTSVRFESVVESDEIYLLSAGGRDAVKVRSGLMDVKHLEQVDDDGLELWKPVMKAPLPISAADAAVRDLGLESRPNTSVPRGLKTLFELDPA